MPRFRSTPGVVLRSQRLHRADAKNKTVFALSLESFRDGRWFRAPLDHKSFDSERRLSGSGMKSWNGRNGGRLQNDSFSPLLAETGQSRERPFRTRAGALATTAAADISAASGLGVHADGSNREGLVGWTSQRGRDHQGWRWDGSPSFRCHKPDRCYGFVQSEHIAYRRRDTPQRSATRRSCPDRNHRVGDGIVLGCGMNALCDQWSSIGSGV